LKLWRIDWCVFFDLFNRWAVMAYTLTVGSLRCHILSDGLQYTDGGGFFGLIPRAMWQEVIAPNDLNQIPSDSRCLLIESAAGLILVDAGNGDKLPPKVRARLGMDDRNGRLLGELARVGFAPEDVDLVLLTHFHGDHIGGATRWGGGDQETGAGALATPVFPRARYIGQRVELADASFPNERTAATYPAENFRPLVESGRLEIVDGPQRPAPGVRTEMAPGHRPGLQVVWVEDGGESLLFLSDAAPWAVQLERLAWVPAYDIAPLESMETKRRLRLDAAERKARLVFQHDAQVVTAHLQPGKRGLVVVPEITEAADFDPSR
jgi:glyoxylase-like metal-dependent hydrolase (beta-lactamase superfamily II)